MTRPLALTQRQAEAIIRAAEATHAVAEVKIGDAVVRLIPAVLAPKSRF